MTRVSADFALVGVDACNTALGVLIFAAGMNLGQSWATFLTLFGCELSISGSEGFLGTDNND